MRVTAAILRFLLAVLALLLLAGLAGYFILRSSLPVTGGNIEVPRLQQELTITRDSYGVPHIQAASLHDAYFGLGFVHAQDRLWQMEFQRRVGSGRLAEAVGEPGLATDRFIRTLGVRQAAEAAVGSLDPSGLAALQAYADGVNAYLNTRRGLLPPEFLLLGIEPEPWTPADTVSWAKMMAWDMAGNQSRELQAALLQARLGDAALADLYPAPARAWTPTIPGSWTPEDPVEPDGFDDLPGIIGSFDLAGLIAALPAPLPEGSGSNAWVVSGDHTASGMPLLANDPHLGLNTPSLFYLVRMSAPGLEVVGGSLPGTPAVLLGRNENIAWGFTNTGTDVQDIFIERTMEAGDTGAYETPDGFEDFTIRNEVIKVKGREDVLLRVRETRHGPVISDLAGDAGRVVDIMGADGNTYVLALSWTALDPVDRTAQAAVQLNLARNWDEFNEALEDFHNPQQNIMYADIQGNIGLVVPGRVPIRAGGTGLLPAPGWTGEFDWTGWVPYDELPRVLNPEGGMLVQANQPPVPDDYPHHISSSWADPYRTDRILELLAQTGNHTPATFARMQLDQKSLMALDFLPWFLSTRPETAGAASAQSLLLNWDGTMSPDAAQPLIMATWLRELQTGLLRQPLGPELFGSYAGKRAPFLERVLNGENVHPWCAGEGCAAERSAALTRAVDWLQEQLGSDMRQWRWDSLHVARQDHQVMGGTKLARLFNLSVPTGGDAYTVSAASFSDFGSPYDQTHGAAFRSISDLSGPHGTMVQSTGQSGIALSPHYRDQQQLWLDNQGLPMHSDTQGGTLVLRPR